MTLEELKGKKWALGRDKLELIDKRMRLEQELINPIKAKIQEIDTIVGDIDRQITALSVPPVDRSNQCTTDGRSPEEVRAEQQQDSETGQHKSYIVLCEEERAKGWVRPFRDKYIHVGVGGHEIDPNNPIKHGRTGNGCGVETRMGRSIAETYCRDPKFYGATFCVGCNAHFPVAEFVWEDGTVVGS